MANVHRGKLSGNGRKIAIIAGRFNEIITEFLVKGAINCLEQHSCNANDIDVYWVPGAFEVPSMAKKVVQGGGFDGVICLGAVIRGETPHFDYICAEATKGVGQVAMNADIPVVFGILTTNTVEQARDRAGAKSGNKGWEAAMAVMEMIGLLDEIKR